MSEEQAVTTARLDRGFAFVDLSGFTRYTDEHGDDMAVELLRTFRLAVRDAASSRGVRIAKWLGDGAMLVGVETEPLLEAVVAISERISTSGSPLPLRAGISIGPVMLFEGDDYIGHAVNVAARLCDAAESNEVLATADSVSSLLVNTHVEPVGERVVPGVEEPIPVVRLSVKG